MKKITLIFISTILLNSCFVNLEEWYENDQIKIPVVESYLCPDSIFKVDLYFSNNLNDVNQKEFITDAKIALFENSHFIDSIVHFKNGQYISANGNNPKANQRYSIEITIPEYGILSASDSIPSAPNVTSINITPEFYYQDVFPLSKNAIHFTDIKEHINFYEIYLKFKEGQDSIYKLANMSSNSKIIKEEAYYPIQEMMKNTSFHYLPFSNINFDKKEMEIDILYQTTISQTGGDTYYHQEAHNLITCIKMVSENYYLFKSSLLQQLENREGNPLFGLSAPINIYSNITGNGTGIFAAYNQVSDTSFVETNF